MCRSRCKIFFHQGFQRWLKKVTRVCISVILKKSIWYLFEIKMFLIWGSDSKSSVRTGFWSGKVQHTKFNFWWMEEQSISKLTDLHSLYIIPVLHLASLKLLLIIFFYGSGLSKLIVCLWNYSCILGKDCALTYILKSFSSTMEKS